MSERWTPAYDRLFDPDHDLAGDTVCRRFAWLDLCHMAQWRAGVRIVGGTLIPLKRGELLASHRYLAQRWGWSRKKVATFLDVLQHDVVAKLESVRETPKGTVYRIATYDTYANPGDSEEPLEEPASGPGRSQVGATREPPESQVGAKEQQGVTSTTGIYQEAADARATGLAEWLGEDYHHALPDLSEYTQRAIYGLVGPHGTRQDVWGDIAEERRPPLTASAIDSYLAAKGGDSWHQGFFLAIVESSVRSARRPPADSEAAQHTAASERSALENGRRNVRTAVELTRVELQREEEQAATAERERQRMQAAMAALDADLRDRIRTHAERTARQELAIPPQQGVPEIILQPFLARALRAIPETERASA